MQAHPERRLHHQNRHDRRPTALGRHHHSRLARRRLDHGLTSKSGLEWEWEGMRSFLFHLKYYFCGKSRSSSSKEGRTRANEIPSPPSPVVRYAAPTMPMSTAAGKAGCHGGVCHWTVRCRWCSAWRAASKQWPGGPRTRMLVRAQHRRRRRAAADAGRGRVVCQTGAPARGLTCAVCVRCRSGQRTRRTCLTTSNTPNGTTSRSLSRPAQRRAATPVHAVVGARVQAFVKACFRALAA